MARACLATYCHQIEGERGEAVVDIYRLDNGKVVEHWDVIQPIPETAADDKRGGRGLVDRQA